MAFEQLGLNLVMQGVGTFVSDMNRVNTSLMRYVGSMKQYETAMLRTSQANQKMVDQRIMLSYKLLQQDTLTYNRLSDNVDKYSTKATAAIAKVNAIIAAGGTPSGAQKGQITRNINLLQDALTGLVPAQQKVADSQERLNNFVDLGAQINADYNKIANKSVSIVGLLEDTLGMLTKGFGQNTIQGTALGKMFLTLVPEVAGLTFVLDVAKLGLDAVVFGFKTFMSILGTVWNVVKRAVSILFELGKVLVGYVWQGVQTVARAIWNLATAPFQWIIQGLENIWKAIGNIIQIAIGMSFDRILWGIAQRFREIAEEAYNAGVEFQLVQIRLRGLIQREMAETSAIPFSESLAEATVRAKELSYWISSLGVRSIFSTTAIQDIVTLGMAYDYTEEQTKTLTMAVVNFATAMGLDNLAMVRIIENMGQMKAAGKMTGTELRDLARGSFVPVNRVFQVMAKMPSAIEAIRKATGKTITDWQEMKALGATGDIPVELFMQAFIEMVNKDFPNAIENAQTSMQVLQSNIKDFIESFIGWRVITPILDEIAERANKIMNLLISDENRTRFEVIGASFKTIFTRILDFFDQKGPDIETVITNILNGLMTISQIAAEVISGNFYSAYQILSGQEQWWLPDLTKRVWTPPTVPNQYFEDLRKVVDKTNPYYWLVDPGTFTETSNKAQMLSQNVRDSIYSVVKFVEDHQQDIQDFFQDPIGWVRDHGIPIIQDLATKGFEFLKTKAEEALGSIKNWFDTNGPTIVTWINTQFQGALDGLLRFVSTNFGTDNPLYRFFDLIKQVVNYLMTLAGAGTTTEEVWAGGFLVATWQKSGDVAGALDAVTKSFDSLRESVGKLIDEQLDRFGQWVTDHVPGFEIFRDIWLVLKDAFAIVQPSIKAIFDTLGASTYTVGGDFGSFVKTFGDFISIVLRPGINEAAISIKQMLDTITTFIAFVKGISAMWSVFVSDWDKFWGRVQSGLTGVPQPSQVPWSQTINPNSTMQITLLSQADVDAQMKKAMSTVPNYFDVNDPLSPANMAKENAARFTGVIVDTFTEMKNDLVTHSIVPEMMSDIYDVMVRTMDKINMVLPGQVDLMVKEIQRAIDKVEELVRSLAKVNVNVTVGSGGTGTSTQTGWIPEAGGGAFIIPKGFEGDRWPLGGGIYGTSGELVTISSVFDIQKLREQLAKIGIGSSKGSGLTTVTQSSMVRNTTINNTRNNNYNLAVSTNQPIQSVISQYEIMKALV